MDSPTDLRSTLRAQCGVVSRGQAHDAGLSVDQIEYRLLSGEWIAVHPGVYRLASAVPTPEAAMRAASLFVCGRGVLIGWGAAWWWAMVTDPPGSWQFSTGQRYTLPTRPGISAARTFVDPREVTARLGVAIASRPLAVLTTAVALERRRPGDGIALIDRAKQKRWVSQADLERTFVRHRGTWGSRPMGRLLDRTGDQAHSELERAGIRELRAAGISGFVVNHRTVLAGGRWVELDVAFVEQRVGLEFDGYAYHSSAERHRSDLRRANEIMASGWVIRRFTWSDVLTDPDGFIATVREVLAEREALG